MEVARWDDGAEVGLLEFFFSEGGKLVDSHVVGPELVAVVGFDFGEVFVEDSLPVCLFELGLELDVELGHPGFELAGFGVGLSLSDEDSDDCDDSQDCCDYLSTHIKSIMNL